jgi:formylglycine-generating enzyme required for sulfatase activity
MEPISTALLVTTLFEITKTLAEKALVEPALKKGLSGFQERLTRDYDQAQAAQELDEAMTVALDEMRTKERGKQPLLRATLKLTDLDVDAQRLLVTTAVTMVRPQPSKIAKTLLNDLVFEERDKEWLAVYLAYLRQNLAKRPFFQPLLAYADRLEELGLLDTLVKEVEQANANTQAIASYVKIVAHQRHLTDDDESALGKYLALGRENWGGIMLPLIRHRIVDGQSYRLRQIFVPLLLQDKRAEEKARQKAERMQRKPEALAHEEDDKTHPVGFTDLISRYNSFVLIGKPGSGKTTLFRRAALAFAEGRAEEDMGWQGKPLFPIFLRLRNFGEFLQSQAGEQFCDPAPGALLDYLKNRYQNGEYMDLTPDFFSRRLEEGDCIVLLDGLDEVAQNRDEVVQHLNAFIKKYKQGNYFGISSRPGGYGRDEETALRAAQLARAEVAPLNARDIRQLIENLLAVMEWEHERERKTAMQDLPGSILASADLTSIASVPLFCSALVQVYKYNKAKLPERRVDVLDEIVTLLLGHWHASKGEVISAKELGIEDGTQKKFRSIQDSVDHKSRRLRYLAYHMHTVAQQYEIESAAAKEVLTEYFIKKERVKDPELAEEYAEGFLLNSHERSGLLAEIRAATPHKPAVYAFIHQNFAEFLAATEIINRGELLQTVISYIEDPWWEQVILFAGAQRGPFDNLRMDMILGLIDKAAERERGSDSWERHLSMAGHLARDMAGHLDGGVREELEDLLREMVTDPSLAPQMRANLADILDELWVPADLHRFVPIPSEENPDFLLAKYPVTNAQYLRFLEADDFHAKEHWINFPKFDEKSETMASDWGDAGYKWLKENWDERKKVYPRYWSDPRFGNMRPNAPIVGISWYEANAYARWLLANWADCEESKTLAKPTSLRLPTRAEWVRAAGGAEPVERFPWDDVGKSETTKTEEKATIPAVLRHANMSESKISRTTPVWTYPLGASQPYGLMDLGGNVWEWQASYRNKSHNALQLSGGSWSSSWFNARVSALSYSSPLIRSYSRGFRVLALPS